MVAPPGIEPGSEVPETSILSIELGSQITEREIRYALSKNNKASRSLSLSNSLCLLVAGAGLEPTVRQLTDYEPDAKYFS